MLIPSGCYPGWWWDQWLNLPPGTVRDGAILMPGLGFGGGLLYFRRCRCA